MKHIIIVSGSVRPNSVNEKVVSYVSDRVASRDDLEAKVVNLGELALPFFDAPLPPSNPDFEPTNEAAKAWTKLVGEADGVVFVTPEYNHNLSPIQLNAIDWIGKEWDGKPVALIGYGWTSGANQAHAAARESLAVNLKARIGDDQANLFLGKHLSPMGDVIEAEQVASLVDASLDELAELIG